MTRTFVSTRIGRLIVAVALAAGALIAVAAPQAAATGGSATDWMNQGKWGVMEHYLAEGCPIGCSFGSYVTGQWPTTAQWNARVGAYDIPGVVKQLKSVGASWLQIAVGQNSGYYDSPNATFEQLVPPTAAHPDRLAKRDLIKDLGTALHAAGRKLIVYITADTVQHDPYTQQRLGGPPGTTDPNPTYQANWLKVVTTWAKQWGTLVDGYWVDGAYYPALSSYYTQFAQALRSGNPNALVTFNPGAGNVLPVTTAADYTAGETNPDEWPVYPTGRFVDNQGVATQTHYLSDAQGYWGNPPNQPMSFSADMLVSNTVGVTDAGGAVTWDVGYDRSNGHISDLAMAELGAVGKATGTTRGVGVRTDDTSPAVTYTGAWTTASAPRYYDGSAHLSTAAAASASFSFTGSSITWISGRSAASGGATVQLDGRTLTPVVPLDSSPPTGNDVVFALDGLTHGPHTLTVTANSDAPITVDGFEVGQPDVDDSSPLITYRGNWIRHDPGGCFDGTCHDTDVAGSSATYRFHGSGITWYGITGPGQGTATVAIDGVTDATVDLSAPARSVDVPVYSKTGLPLDSNLGEHTITITLQDNSWLTLDRLAAIPLAADIVDDSDPAVTYTGPWIQYNPGGCDDGTCHDVQATGATATLGFTGTGITVYGITGPDQGSIDVYLDGALDSTVNLYAASRNVVVPVYTKTGLTAGSHTIEIVTQDANWVTIDAFQLE